MRLRWAGLLIAALATGGCDVAEDILDGNDDVDPCGDSASTPNLSGTWRLTGTGTRNDCSDERFEGSFQLETSSGLRVVQEADPAATDGRQRVRLESVPEGLDFGGTVRGTCVNLEVQESFEGTLVHYSFTGTHSPSGQVSGTFTGTGPTGCRAEGTFSLQVL